MATRDLTATPPDSYRDKAVSMAEIKQAYPGEWVLIGNPVMDEGNLHVLSGIPLFHSFDKREIAYLWRDRIKAYDTYTLVFNRVVVPGQKRRGILPLLLRIPQ